ncbi:MAG TPA: SgcJ/EcaC family oxidoreductase [Candidatus Acidoferrales bacterium]|nr:SgcJ/EcaC family oxidoreductase [Candidatus Acidoferrales bacterium]
MKDNGVRFCNFFHRSCGWRHAAAATAPRDQKDIRALQHAFTTAWDRADAGALAALFTADGDVITPDGTVLVHRDGIESFYGTIFKNGYAGSHGQAHLVRLEFIRQMWLSPMVSRASPARVQKMASRARLSAGCTRSLRSRRRMAG